MKVKELIEKYPNKGVVIYCKDLPIAEYNNTDNIDIEILNMEVLYFNDCSYKNEPNSKYWIEVKF